MPPAETDVVVTNAALQWVPGHQEMLARWLAALQPGAWFAMQVPGNFNAPSHTLMRELAGSARWAPQLAGVLRGGESVGEPADYLGIMLDAGCTADAWETTYQQVLPGTDPVLEWVRGTALRPVLAVLSAEDGAAFEAEYAAALRAAYPGQLATAPCFRSGESSPWPAKTAEASNSIRCSSADATRHAM